MLNKVLLLLCTLLVISSNCFATTYYIREDGGRCQDITSSGYDTPSSTFFAKECDGLTDAALSGADGTNCACNHPNWVLGANAGNSRMYSAGDTIIIDGDYQIGCSQDTSNCLDYSVNLNDSTKCYSTGGGGCYMSLILGGVDTNNKTKVYGKNYSSCSADSDKAELWGAGWVKQILSTSSEDHIDIRCLRLTDHETCGYLAPSDGCSRAYNELAADNGIYSVDSEDVYIKDVDIIGVNTGIKAGRIGDWSLEDVRLEYNMHAGWNGDITLNDDSNEDDHNTGPTDFDNVTFIYNGCSDTYPTEAPGECGNDGTNASLYGDGLGTGLTGQAWSFIDCIFKYNTSDGLDMLYTDEATIYINRTLFEGNAGNQVKFSGDSKIENSIVIGNCKYHDGKSFDTSGFNHCRAGGDLWAAQVEPNDDFEIYNSTFIVDDAGNDNGNNFFMMGDANTNCDSSTTLTIKNSIFNGGKNYEGSDIGFVYRGECNNATETYTNLSFEDVAIGGSTPIGSNIDLNDPLLIDTTGDTFDVGLTSSSPARDSADESINITSENDYNNYYRSTSWDIGALEYGSTPTEPSEDNEGSLSGITLTGVTFN